MTQMNGFQSYLCLQEHETFKRGLKSLEDEKWINKSFNDISESYLSDTEDSTSSNDEEEESSHELCIQSEGDAFTCPIMFQDGMDYEECEDYYLVMQAQKSGGVLRHNHIGDARRRELSKTKDFVSPSIPESIFRKRKPSVAPAIRRRSTGDNEEKRMQLVRHFSFSGLLVSTGISRDEMTLHRSASLRNLSEDTKPHVSFKDRVEVFTICSHSELPSDVRSKLWMSKEEVRENIRIAKRR